MVIGLVHRKRTKDIGDMIPVSGEDRGHIKDSKEFTASTVATSISLATVVLFFFEAAPGLGVWLLWCALTTAVGILVVRLFSKKIWHRLSAYDHRPSLHEFLGVEFGSMKVSTIGAVVTSLGYLGIFGLELYIGSIFLSSLAPEIPQWLVVVIVSIVGFLYTALGGFRTVIVTDRIQMYTIWVFIAALFSVFAFHLWSSGSIEGEFAKIPTNLVDFSWSDSLLSFIVGILVINACMFIVSMSIWQRIAASSDPTTVTRGLWRSSIFTGLSWALLIFAAILVFMVVSPVEGVNPLTTLLQYSSENFGLLGKVVLFLSVIGLFGSQLSTASTQLIATAHTVYEDILAPMRKKDVAQQIRDKGSELMISRVILVSVAIAAILIVAALSASGFSIVDMAFALYGGQLALFPLVILALVKGRPQLSGLSSGTVIAVVLGLVAGWSGAIFGKLNGIQDLVFLSPVISLITSTVIILIAYMFKSQTKRIE